MDLSNEWLRYATNVESLDVSGNPIKRAGLAALTEAISTEHSLTYLNASHISVGPPGGPIIATFVGSCSSLTELNVSTNGFGPSAGQIATAMVESKSSLCALNIANNGIGPGRAMSDVADLLAQATESGACPKLRELDMSNNRMTSRGCDKIISSINGCGLRSFTMQTDQTVGLEKQVELLVTMKNLSSLQKIDMGSLLCIPRMRDGVSDGSTVAQFFNKPLSFAVEHGFYKLAEILISWRNDPAIHKKTRQHSRNSAAARTEGFVVSEDARDALRLAIRLPEARDLVWFMIGMNGSAGIVYDQKSRVKCQDPKTREDLDDAEIEIATDLWSCGQYSPEDGSTALLCALNYDCIDVATAIIKRNRARSCSLSVGIRDFDQLLDSRTAEELEHAVLLQNNDTSFDNGMWCRACDNYIKPDKDNEGKLCYHASPFCTHPSPLLKQTQETFVDCNTSVHRTSSRKIDVVTYTQWPDLANVNAGEEGAAGSGVTALRLAASRGYSEIVELLLGVADVSKHMNALDFNRRVAMHDVCRGPLGTVDETITSYGQALLDAGAVMAVDWQGKTPLHYAAALGHDQMISLLFNHASSSEGTDANAWINARIHREEHVWHNGYVDMRTGGPRSHNLHPWQTRYVVLAEGHLHWYKNEQDFRAGMAPLRKPTNLKTAFVDDGELQEMFIVPMDADENSAEDDGDTTAPEKGLKFSVTIVRTGDPPAEAGEGAEAEPLPLMLVDRVKGGKQAEEAGKPALTQPTQPTKQTLYFKAEKDSDRQTWIQAVHDCIGEARGLDDGTVKPIVCPPWSAVAVAALHGHSSCLFELLENGADPLLLASNARVRDCFYRGQARGWNAPGAYFLSLIRLKLEARHVRNLQNGHQTFLTTAHEEHNVIDQGRVETSQLNIEISTAQLEALHSTNTESEGMSCKETRQRFAVAELIADTWGYIAYLAMVTYVGLMVTRSPKGEAYLELHKVVETSLLEPLGNFDETPWSDVASYDEFFEHIKAVMESKLFVMEADTFNPMNYTSAVVPMVVRQFRTQPTECGDVMDSAGGTQCFALRDEDDSTTFGRGTLPIWSAGGDRWFRSTDGWLGWDKWPVSGFTEVFFTNEADAAGRWTKLGEEKWFDAATRVVYVDVAVYNPSTGAFEVVEMVAEFLRSGAVKTSSQFAVLTLPTFVRLSFEWLLMCYSVYYSYQEMVEIGREVAEHGPKDGLREYFLNFWNVADWAMVCLLFAFFILSSASFSALNDAIVSLESSTQTAQTTQQFVHAAWFAKQQQLVLAFTISLAWLKAFKFVKLIPVIGPAFYATVATLGNGQVLLFLGIFIWFVLAIALGCHVGFGIHVDGFGAVSDSFLAIFQATFDPSVVLEDFQAQSYAAGLVFFFILALLGSLTLLNIFIAVVSNVYSEKELLANANWEKEVNLLHGKRLERTVWNTRLSSDDRTTLKWYRRYTQFKWETVAAAVVLLAGVSFGSIAKFAFDEDDKEEDLLVSKIGISLVVAGVTMFMVLHSSWCEVEHQHRTMRPIFILFALLGVALTLLKAEDMCSMLGPSWWSSPETRDLYCGSNSVDFYGTCGIASFVCGAVIFIALLLKNAMALRKVIRRWERQEHKEANLHSAAPVVQAIAVVDGIHVVGSVLVEASKDVGGELVSELVTELVDDDPTNDAVDLTTTKSWCGCCCSRKGKNDTEAIGVADLEEQNALIEGNDGREKPQLALMQVDRYNQDGSSAASPVRKLQFKEEEEKEQADNGWCACCRRNPVKVHPARQAFENGERDGLLPGDEKEGKVRSEESQEALGVDTSASWCCCLGRRRAKVAPTPSGWVKGSEPSAEDSEPIKEEDGPASPRDKGKNARQPSAKPKEKRTKETSAASMRAARQAKVAARARRDEDAAQKAAQKALEHKALDLANAVQRSQWRPSPLQTYNEARDARIELVLSWRKNDNEAPTIRELVWHVLEALCQRGRDNVDFGKHFELNLDGEIMPEQHVNRFAPVVARWQRNMSSSAPSSGEGGAGPSIDENQKQALSADVSRRQIHSAAQAERTLLAVYDTCLETLVFAWGSHPQLPTWHEQVNSTALLTEADWAEQRRHKAVLDLHGMQKDMSQHIMDVKDHVMKPSSQAAGGGGSSGDHTTSEATASLQQEMLELKASLRASEEARKKAEEQREVDQKEIMETLKLLLASKE